jgi:hypothetical protein
LDADPRVPMGLGDVADVHAPATRATAARPATTRRGADARGGRGEADRLIGTSRRGEATRPTCGVPSRLSS